MSTNEIPFYTQTSLLDRYISEIDPKQDQEVIEVILDVLWEKEHLRRYFFQNRPSPKWAKILWENKFFDSPPAPEKTEEGVSVLPHWDVQEFLINNAEEASGVVIKHIQNIEGNGFYISRAIKALCKLPPEKAVDVLDKIISWLNDPHISSRIGGEVYEYMGVLIMGEKVNEAINVFREFAKPHLMNDFGTVSTRSATSGPVVTIYDNTPEKKFKEIDVLHELTARCPETMSQVLMSHLESALILEGKEINRPDLEGSSWWRVAVEETGQDLENTAKEKILGRFLNTLQSWARINFPGFQSFLEELLTDNRNIFYRVGLYLLSIYPERLSSSVNKELMKFENLDNTEIRHEHFLLLNAGFPFLEQKNRKSLIKYVLSGPPENITESFKSHYEDLEGTIDLPKEKYIQSQASLWVRTRLWMIREYLPEKAMNTLDALLEKYGEPEHPTYHSWSSGGGFVRSVSPISHGELTNYSPSQLLSFINNWEPKYDHQDVFVDINYRGLAKEVAKTIYDNTYRYEEVIADIFKSRPIFASELLQYFQNSNELSNSQWKIVLDVCLNILREDVIRTSGDWIWARQCITNLINTGFQRKSHNIPESLLPKAKEVLLILINDPDPKPEDETIPTVEDINAFEDPLTRSLNHVRPNALQGLILYAIFRCQETSPSIRLEDDVKKALNNILAKTKKKSFSIYSVFGKNFPRLYWVDEQWAKTNIDKIFPEITDKETLWYFQSSWDAYITNNYFYDIRDIMNRYYTRAIDNVSRGLFTRKDVIKPFTTHLVLDYLLFDHGDNVLSNESIPVIRMIRKGKPTQAASVAWSLWKVCHSNTNKVQDWWPKVKKIWKWRVHEASQAHHQSDFDQEIRYYAWLLELAPDHESIITLYPMLEGMLPHIVNIRHRDKGWDSLEMFLATQVDMHPLECIHLYQHMRVQRGEDYIWRQETEEAKKIIETGASNPGSRQDTLSLIDYLGSIGNHSYRHIYETYT